MAKRTKKIKKTHLRYAIKNKIYRADAKDLGLSNTKKAHDVIVVSVNKRRKKCRVKTITSLERDIKGKMCFIDDKLDDVRNGIITPIPIKDINTHHWSGVNNNAISVKTNKLYFSTTGTKFPRRYKHIINSNK